MLPMTVKMVSVSIRTRTSRNPSAIMNGATLRPISQSASVPMTSRTRLLNSGWMGK